MLYDCQLIDSSRGRKALDQTLTSFLSDTSPDRSMGDYVRDFRLELAHLLDSEDCPTGAVAALDHHSVPESEAIQALIFLRDNASSPDARSVYRHALAAVFYNSSDLSSARLELQQELADLEVGEEQRDLASRKLYFLRGKEPPPSWHYRIVPEELRSDPISIDRFDMLCSDPLRRQDGFMISFGFIDALKQAGYYREAIELCERVFEANRDNPGETWNIELQFFEVLLAAGQPDRAISLLEASSGRDPKHAGANYGRISKAYQQLGMSAQALYTAAQARDYARGDREFGVLHLDRLNLLLAEGMIDDALSEVDRFAHRSPLHPNFVKEDILQFAIRSSTSRAGRSELRRALAGHHLSTDNPLVAQQVLMHELSGDPGISLDNQRLAQEMLERADLLQAAS